jgi:hypothetical protein
MAQWPLRVAPKGAFQHARAVTGTYPASNYSDVQQLTHSLADSDFHGHRPAV